MAHKAMSPNQREVISAVGLANTAEYLTSTNGALNINGSFSVTGGATSANQTNGQQLVQIVDAGGEAATVTGGKLDVNATASLAGTALPISGATTAVGVAIVDSSGNQISSFGGGTQYVDGSSTAAHPTGTIPVYDNAGTIASVSTTNRLPVSATQSGTWNITNVSGTVSLPTGAATAAKQPALGTAGTASSDVITIQGIASMTKLLVTPDLPTGASTAANQTNASQKTQIVDGSGNVIASSGNALNVNATFSPSGTQDINLKQIAGGTAINAGITGTMAIGGNQATNNNVSTNVSPVLIAGSDYGGTAKIQNWKVDSSGIGQVNFSNTTIAVTNTGTFVVQATLAAETTKVIGTVNQGTSPWIVAGGGTAGSAATGVVTVQGIASMTPILATVTATNLSTNIAQIGGATVAQGHGTAAAALRVELPTDGTGVIATVGAVTAISNALPAGSNVIGHVIADTGSTTAVTGNVTVVQGTGTNLHTVLDSGTLTTLTTLTGTTTLTPGTGAANLGKAEDAVHSSGDVGVFSLNVGNEAQSTFAADGDYIAQAVDTKGNTFVTGPIASGGTVGTRPVTTGSRAATALPSAVADTQAVNNMSDKYGRPVVLNNAIRDIMGTQTTTITASTSETTIISQAAAIFNDLVSIFISNSSATAVRVDIRDTTAGSVIFQFYIPAGDMRGISLTTPWIQTTVNTNWTATSSASVTSLFVSALFIKNK